MKRVWSCSIRTLPYEADFGATVGLVEAATMYGGLVAAKSTGGDGRGTAAQVDEVFAYLVGSTLGEGCVVAVVRIPVYMTGDFYVEVAAFDNVGQSAEFAFGLGGELPVGGVEEDAVEGMGDAILGHLDVGGELEVVCDGGWCGTTISSRPVVGSRGWGEIYEVRGGEIKAVIDV